MPSIPPVNTGNYYVVTSNPGAEIEQLKLKSYNFETQVLTTEANEIATRIKNVQSQVDELRAEQKDRNFSTRSSLHRYIYLNFFKPITASALEAKINALNAGKKGLKEMYEEKQKLIQASPEDRSRGLTIMSLHAEIKALKEEIAQLRRAAEENTPKTRQSN